MNKQLLEQFKRGEVILYTPKFEDFKALMEWCDVQTIRWCDGEKATHDMSITFESFNDNSQGIKSDREGIFYVIKNKATFKAKNLEPDKQEFTKDDLKVGMIVELRNGNKCAVLKYSYEFLEDSSSYLPKYYDNDLTRLDKRKPEKELDIVKVYTTNNLIEVLEGKYDSLELVCEREHEVDWTKVEVDTKVLVKDNQGKWLKRRFAKYENNKVYVWAGGRDSFTAKRDFGNCTYNFEKVKLYEEK